MTRKLHFLLTVFLGVLCGSALHSLHAAETPNIILIVADDLGWSDLPEYGNRFNEAPHLSRLAEQGMRFTDAYAANPVCSPPRARLMTEQSSARIGIHDWITGHWRPFEALRVPVNRTQHLPHDLTTIAEALRTQGYVTGMSGKWHLGHGPDTCPPRPPAMPSSVVRISFPPSLNWLACHGRNWPKPPVNRLMASRSFRF